MKIPIYQIDAFTDEQFKGNPAAVCPLDKWIQADVMQQIADENNLPETAFFVTKGDGYELKWFTPKGEVDLCGHATLATAYVICTYLDTKKAKLLFHTKSGNLEVVKDDNLFTLSFPTREGRACDIPEELLRGLGKMPKEIYFSRDYLAVFESEEDILELDPDMEALKKLEGFGVIVTAKGKKVDFVSRFFAPKAGIDEDQVTGSAHCTLVPYWKNRLKKNVFVAEQLSERGGKLYCTDAGELVKIAGTAVVYLEGQLII